MRAFVSLIIAYLPKLPKAGNLSTFIVRDAIIRATRDSAIA